MPAARIHMVKARCLMHRSIKRNQARAVRGTGAMRDKAVAIAMKRKEEYLGARVPRELKDRVIERAHELGIPVSILIRRVLEEAFEGECGVNTGVFANRADTNQETGVKGRPNRFPAVLGWEKINLNRPVKCSGCGGGLEPGVSVTLGVGAPGEQHVILCDLCKRSI